MPATPSTSREANFDIRFGFGIDELGALFEAAELCGVVERKGSYYYFGSDKLSQVRLGVVTAGATVTFLDGEMAGLPRAWRNRGPRNPALSVLLLPPPSQSICVVYVQGKENAMVKVRESEDLQKRLREAIRTKLANGEVDLPAASASDDEDDDPAAQLGPYEAGTEFDPAEP